MVVVLYNPAHRYEITQTNCDKPLEWEERKKSRRRATDQREVRSDGDPQTGTVHNDGPIGHRIRDERGRNGGHSSTENRRASWKFESRKYSSPFLWLPPL